MLVYGSKNHMDRKITFTKNAYDASATSECWWYTPYDKNDPEYWKHVSRDPEMRDIHAMELTLGGVPAWAWSVGIGYLPPCGHYTFPAPMLQVLDLIGAASQKVVDSTFKVQCYTADRTRKQAADDVCRLLDTWLEGTASTDLQEVLGTHTEKTVLLVERVLLAIQNSICTFRWHDDPGTPAETDEHIQEIDSRLHELDPQWRQLFKIDLGRWWLCAPNAFRLLEYDLWAIGHDRMVLPGDTVPKFLGSDSTCPDRMEAAVWWHQFIITLDGWWQGIPTTGVIANNVNRRLGESTPVKRWLVRLYLRKLRMLASYKGEGLSKTVNLSM